SSVTCHLTTFPLLPFLRPHSEQPEHFHGVYPPLFEYVQLSDDIVERVEKPRDIIHQHIHRTDRERLRIIEETGCKDIDHDCEYERSEALQKILACRTLEIDQSF